MNGIANWSEATPSYGRDYTTAKAVKDDFLAGKDFTLASTGQQFTIRDLAPGTTVLLRYKRKTGVTPFKLTHTMAKGLGL